MQNNDQVNKLLDDVLNKYGKQAVDTVSKKLIDSGKQDSNIIKSLKYDYKVNDNHIELNINLNDYWIYIQLGRKAGGKLPPKIAIEDWMKRKNIDLKYSFPIRKKIAEFGIKPIDISSFLTNPNSEFNKSLLKDIEKVIGKGVEIKIFDSISEYNKNKK